MSQEPRQNPDGKRRRGSALILVMAVLTVLAIFSLTLAYNTRLELTATRNWAEGARASMATVSGIPAFFTDAPLVVSTSARQAASSESSVSLSGTTTSGASLQTVKIRVSRNRLQGLITSTLAVGANASTGSSRPLSSVTTTGSSAVSDDGQATGVLTRNALQDASAKININAIVPVSEFAVSTTVDLANASAGSSSSATSSSSGAKSVSLEAGFLSEDVLARFIKRVLGAHGIGGIDAQAVAHAIAIRRYGADGKPGKAGVDDDKDGQAADDSTGLSSSASSAATAKASLDVDNDGLDNNHDGQADESNEGIDDPSESLSDIRLRPNGDDAPWSSVKDLAALPGMTAKACAALAPYLTVFSVSREAFDLTGIQGSASSSTDSVMGYPQINPNIATKEEIFAALQRRFPNAPESLLAQFAVNVVDRRDSDSIPTEWRRGDQLYLGLETNPCINEVCSSVPSAQGDGGKGQFIELYNPYDKALSINGWQIQGAGATITLAGQIPAGGYRVLTDNFNNENSNSTNSDTTSGNGGSDSSSSTTDYQSGTGSFYNIFHKVSTGDAKRIDEYPTLNLPDDSGEVMLLDASGHLIDDFPYSGGAWKGATRSFQRADPRVHAATLALATPLAANVNASSAADSDAEQTALKIQKNWQNKPFSSPLEVMLASSAFAPGSSDDATTSGSTSGDSTASNWALPVLKADGNDQLDVRLVDCFQVDRGIIPLTSSSSSSSLSAADSDDASSTTTGCKEAFGRINLNAASGAVLSALPGMSDALLSKILVARLQCLAGSTSGAAYGQIDAGNIAWWREISPIDASVWPNLSDFLLDDNVWQSSTLYARLDAVYPFLPLVTTHGLSARVLSVARQAQSSGALIVERIMADDRGGLETVAFDSVNRGSPLSGR